MTTTYGGGARVSYKLKLAEASHKYEYMNLYLTIMIKCLHDTTYPTRHPLSATFLTPNEIFQISNCQE